ncbi:MAG: N-acetylmuramoyl-L-alanine amidase [Puniceicoccaceae bacterium]|nr:MAG: N-acetylmuramoyl-L-alanine amidase [Puniceicoccaceae bacterium]
MHERFAGRTLLAAVLAAGASALIWFSACTTTPEPGPVVEVAPEELPEEVGAKGADPVEVSIVVEAKPPPPPPEYHGVEYTAVTSALPGWTMESLPEEDPPVSRWTSGLGGEWIFAADSRAAHFRGVRVWLSWPAVFDGKSWLVSRPDVQSTLAPLSAAVVTDYFPTRQRTILLDPGHGGRDTGARNEDLDIMEKDLALDWAQRAGRLLEADGFAVVYTRYDDRFVSLEDRAALARRNAADLFISLHFNAAGNPDASGIESFVLTPARHPSTNSGGNGETGALPGNRLDDLNLLLGYQLQAAQLRRTGLNDRGLRRARFTVLRDLECPGVLLEGGFLSNRQEARLIATPGYRERLAEAVREGVLDYFRHLPEPPPETGR